MHVAGTWAHSMSGMKIISLVQVPPITVGVGYYLKQLEGVLHPCPLLWGAILCENAAFCTSSSLLVFLKLQKEAHSSRFPYCVEATQGSQCSKPLWKWFLLLVPLSTDLSPESLGEEHGTSFHQLSLHKLPPMPYVHTKPSHNATPSCGSVLWFIRNFCIDLNPISDQGQVSLSLLHKHTHRNTHTRAY